MPYLSHLEGKIYLSNGLKKNIPANNKYDGKYNPSSFANEKSLVEYTAP